MLKHFVDIFCEMFGMFYNISMYRLECWSTLPTYFASRKLFFCVFDFPKFSPEALYEYHIPYLPKPKTTILFWGRWLYGQRVPLLKIQNTELGIP